MENLQVVCSKTLTAKPQAVEQVMKMCQSVTEFSQGRISDRTSGIQEFSCSKDRWEENVFHFWERYESNGAMGKHNTSIEVKGFMEKVSARASGVNCAGTCSGHAVRLQVCV